MDARRRLADSESCFAGGKPVVRWGRKARDLPREAAQSPARRSAPSSVERHGGRAPHAPHPERRPPDGLVRRARGCHAGGASTDALRCRDAPPQPAQAGSPPVLLGTADSFAVLAGSTITNVGPSVINGDLGLHPSTAVVGFPPGTLNGAEHVERCRRPDGRDRPDDGVQRRRWTAAHFDVAPRHRRANAHGRRLQERVGRLARADRAPDAGRAGRPARGVHLPDPVDAHHGNR